MRACRLALMASVAWAVPLVPALAQSASSAASPPVAEAPAATDTAQDNDLGLNEIIVTGTRTGTRKFETSYAITTIDPQAIAQKEWAELIQAKEHYVSRAATFCDLRLLLNIVTNREHTGWMAAETGSSLTIRLVRGCDAV